MKKLIISVMFLAALSAVGQNFNPNEFVPMPTPVWAEPVSVTGHENQLVGFDPVTGIETITDPGSISGNTTENQHEPWLPSDLPFTEEEPAGSDNFNNCEFIENTGYYHYSTCVKLFISFPDGYNCVASGVMVGRCVVLTAGHCVYSKDHGGWAAHITASPGFNDNYKPFGDAYSTYVYAWSGWMQSSNFSWDIGLIKLNSPIGNQTGTLGYGWNSDDSFFRNNTFHFLSYPADSPFNGQKMYYCYGNYDQVTTNTIYYNRPCWGGSSGGGIYNKNANGNRYVYAVHSHTSGSQAGQTRITKEKFEWIDKIASESCSPANGVEDLHTGENLSFDLYPNPARDKVTILLKGHHENCSISVNDLLGNKVIQLKDQSFNEKISVSTGTLTPGFYFISIQDGNKTAAKSFIKIL